ncbi:MAG TPA: dihydrolipoyllysine-residue succinyltransferase [Chlamydiales bacterium]|nr:dihydrolipoyllysine-residue succinyltransferase [Chlamydiales bacterium]
MKIEIKIPSMGESVVEATIGSILKPSGSAVRADEEILELETDKVNQVLYAPAAGKLELKVKTGDVVKVGQTIGSVDTEGAGAPAPAAKKMAAPTPPPPEKSKTEATPIRRKTDDFLAEMPREMPAQPRTSSRETRKKMTKLRKVIAQRLVEVKNQTAMLTTFNELDMSAVMQVREKEQENFTKKHGVKLGFMSFFVKACVAALQEFPDVNGRIEGDEIVYNHYCDMSVAVSTEKGLMVPVIRNADQLSYAEIEKQLKILAEKARSGTISVDELQGGTFTITNAGIFGSLFSTPILNPPQSAILGMHNIVKRPVVVNDQIVIRPMMYLALSYDHRIVDGKEAVSFLMHLKKNLEEPARLLLDL